jgi:MFS family permease
MTEEVTYPKYRWLILLMGWAILCLTSYNNTMQNVRYDLREAPPVGLGLSPTEFYLCIVASSVAPIVIALISGLLTDRIGAKRVILYGAIVTVLGALLRVASVGFVDLFIYCVLMGVGLGTVGGNVPKLVGMWFPVRQIYLGIALFTTALGIGPFLALATGAMFPSYFVGFLTMGGVLAAMCVVWAIWAKDRPKEYLEFGKTIVGVPFKESLLTALRSKYIWLIGFSYCLVAAVVAAWVGGLPLLLKETKGVSGAGAGLVTSLSVVGYIIGIVLWTWVAEKVGRMKPVYCVCMALSGTTGLLLYLFAPGIGMWVLGIFPGLFMGAGYPLIMQMPLRLKGIGTRYAGTAMGAIASWGHLISFLMLPFMFTPLWETFGAIYGVVLLCVALWVAGGLFLMGPEVGRKYMQKLLREAQETGATAS